MTKTAFDALPEAQATALLDAWEDSIRDNPRDFALAMLSRMSQEELEAEIEAGGE